MGVFETLANAFDDAPPQPSTLADVGLLDRQLGLRRRPATKFSLVPTVDEASASARLSKEGATDSFRVEYREPCSRCNY